MRRFGRWGAVVCSAAILAACFEDAPPVGGTDGSTTDEASQTSDGPSTSGGTSGISETSPSTGSSTTTTTTMTTATTGATSTGDPMTSTTDDAESGSVGSTVGLVCDADDAEPNNTEEAATVLPDIDDSDGSGSTLSGVLEGAEDTDWFSYGVADGGLAILDPNRTLTMDGPVELCKFYRCNTSEAMPAGCGAGARADVLFDGTSGCCATDQNVAINVECEGGDDSGTVFVRLSTTADECVSYSVDYGA